MIQQEQFLQELSSLCTKYGIVINTNTSFYLVQATGDIEYKTICGHIYPFENNRMIQNKSL